MSESADSDSNKNTGKHTGPTRKGNLPYSLTVANNLKVKVYVIYFDLLILKLGTYEYVSYRILSRRNVCYKRQGFEAVELECQ